jgi:hypothetical protein
MMVRSERTTYIDLVEPASERTVTICHEGAFIVRFPGKPEGAV